MPLASTLCAKISALFPVSNKNPLTAILDERGKSPILRHRRGLAEGVVKNRDLRGARFRVCRSGADRCRRNHQRSNFEEDVASHRMLPRTNSSRRCFSRTAQKIPFDISALVGQSTVAQGSKAADEARESSS